MTMSSRNVLLLAWSLFDRVLVGRSVYVMQPKTALYLGKIEVWRNVVEIVDDF